MESKAWQAHVVNSLRCVQGSQLHSQPCGMIGLDAGQASNFKEPLQTFVLERFNHREIVACCATHGNFSHNVAITRSSQLLNYRNI